MRNHLLVVHGFEKLQPRTTRTKFLSLKSDNIFSARNRCEHTNGHKPNAKMKVGPSEMQQKFAGIQRRKTFTWERTMEPFFNRSNHFVIYFCFDFDGNDSKTTILTNNGSVCLCESTFCHFLPQHLSLTLLTSLDDLLGLNRVHTSAETPPFMCLCRITPLSLIGIIVCGLLSHRI